MRDYHLENLSHDPLHGYIAFSSTARDPQPEVEMSERMLLDHPWVQRLRYIHQLQTAHWVYPTAEHTRFQHVVGVMHLASRVVNTLYESLQKACPEAPSRGYVETLLRMTGLLHDIGHGPFGHFFDEHFLRRWGLNHEILGGQIICQKLGPLLRGLRRNPNSQLGADEQLDPGQIAWLIQRPQPKAAPHAKQAGATERSGQEPPKWLRFLRSLLSGIYTIDNMDFVLRDAYMSGYSQRAFDLDRLLHYSFFSRHGLTIHERGLEALTRFLSVRAELFRSIYFHRTVRAIDLTLADLFADGGSLLFEGNPAEQLDKYLQFTECSLLVDVSRWPTSDDPQKRELGLRWQDVLLRRIPWKMVCQRNLVFSQSDSETSSIFSDAEMVERRIRRLLPPALDQTPLRVDIARHIFRPHTSGPSAGQNFLYDSASDEVRPLAASQLYGRLPISHRICRIYAQTHEHDQELAAAMDELIGGAGSDDWTNM